MPPRDGPKYQLPHRRGSSGPPFENKREAFTQLFSSLGVAGANPTAPTASNLETGDSSAERVVPFTRMLSLEPQSRSSRDSLL